MVTRRQAGAAIALAVIWGLAMSGCTPQPAPVPSASATGFASDDEAFAAAEATYRAYVDATNAVVLSRPSTFESVYSLLAADALRSARQSLSDMHEKGWTVGGASRIAGIERGGVKGDGSVALLVCLDVSSVTLVDANGVSQVGERPAEQGIEVLVSEGADSSWRIRSFGGRSGEPQCKQ